MARWIIYDRYGQERKVVWSDGSQELAQRYTMPQLEYNGSWMGECYVTLTVKCATPIDFQIGDYIIYRGEKFVINYDPGVVKKARKETHGEGFVYENMKFSSLSYELSDVRMLDYVLFDNELHYTGLPEFSFFCNDIDDFADRLQVNAARYCAENNFADADYWVFLTPSLTRSLQRCATSALKNVAKDKYEEVYGSDGTNTYLVDEKKNQNVQISNQSVWDSCKFIKDTFGLNFIVRGRFVIIGAAGLPTSDIFRYGKSNGLYEMNREVDSQQQIITKLFAYGTGTNLPTRYYANINLVCYANVVSGNDLEYIVSVDWNENFFTKPKANADEYPVTIVYGDTTYPSRASLDADTGKIKLEIHDTLNVGQRINFVSGIDKDLWPPEWRDYNNNLPNNMAVNVLMLPGFPNQSLYDWVLANGGVAVESSGNTDSFGLAKWRAYKAYFSKDRYQPYIVSQNYTALGIREAIKHWDGSDDTDDIHPTIEDTGYDVITSAEKIDDNGVFAEGSTVQGFEITLPDFGNTFQLDELMKQSSESTTISMKDGYCGGREFELVSVKQNDNGTWVCKCNRVHDESLDLWFPYSYHKSIGQDSQVDEPYQVRGGDHYVLLGIPMTSFYVEINATRLLAAALEFLSKNDYTRYTYSPKVDEIYMAYQHDSALANSTRSYHDTLKEGDIMLFGDTDLGIDGSVFIDKLIIKEYGNAQIPTYEVTLRNDKQVGTLQRIQNQISSLSSTIGTNGVNIPATKNLIEAYGRELFLSKRSADTASGKITFAQGTQSDKDSEWGTFVKDSTGAAMYQDADHNWHMEADYLHARKKLTAKEVQIEDVHHVGGQQMLTSAAMTADFVVERDGAWRCFFLKQEDSGKAVENKWRAGDQAYVSTFNLVQQEDGTMGNHFLWRLVTATDLTETDESKYTVNGEEVSASDYHFIDLSKTVCAENSDAPFAGDDIVQLGYQPNDDPDRQNAIIQAGAGNASPYIREYTGINTFHLPSPETQLKPGDNLLTGRVEMQTGSTMPDGTTIESFVAQTSNDIASLQSEMETLDTGNENLLRNSGFTGDYESEPTASGTSVNATTEMYSRQLKYWTHDGAVVTESAESASGYGVTLSNGTLSQPLTKPMNADSWYCFSLKGSGTAFTMSLGGYSKTVAMGDSLQRYIVKFACQDASANVLRITNATGLLMELQVTEGKIANTDWLPSPMDNDKSLAYYQSLSYLSSAINNANTTILGGLILSQMIRVGNYRNGTMSQETGGMSGVYASGQSPFLWGGGTMEDAFYTIGKYANNPAYQPTDEEVEQMAKFVVTHGGRAILNDIILRGYIHALGGYFKGEVHADSGVFRNVSSPNGNFSIDVEGNLACVNATISGNLYAPMVKITEDNILWYLDTRPDGSGLLRLDRSGLNVHVDYLPGDADVYLPVTSNYNGAHVNILNMTTYNITVYGKSRYIGSPPVITPSSLGKFYCYHDQGNVYEWIKEN